jgi:phage shock protein C
MNTDNMQFNEQPPTPPPFDPPSSDSPAPEMPVPESPMPNTPTPDPKVELLADDLKKNWDRYQVANNAADLLAQQSSMPDELINTIKQSAKSKLDESVARSVQRYMNVYGAPEEETPKSKPVEEPEISSDKTTNQTGDQTSNQKTYEKAYEKHQTTSDSQPYLEKKLCRVEYDKMLTGVCGGVAEYFHIDSSIVRVLFVLSSVFYGLGAIAYVVLAIILPIKLTLDEE